MKYIKTPGYPAFTLIELMVVITIITIMALASYFPYAHHQKKLMVKQGAREVSQSIAEARNLAIHGLNTGSGNLNVALFFASGASTIDYYVSTGSLSLGSLATADIYKIKDLPQGVQIDAIDGIKTDFLMSYERITGSGAIEPSISAKEFDISLSYKGASSPVLQKNIHYYTQSYITDY